jgi:hypothetical protein
MRKPGTACLLAILLATPAWAGTRVALLGGQGADEAGGVLTLAEAELSGERDILLVDRSQIERLLSEAERSLSGLADGDTAIRVGQILGADVLAVVESEPQSRHALGLLVFETASGMHLWDASLAEANPRQAARQIVEGVQQAARKRSRQAGPRCSICLASVRNADLPPAANAFCDAVGRLLERTLTRSPEIVVLERRRLELIRREIAIGHLGQGTSEQDPLSSLAMVDVDIRRAQGSAMLATVSVHDHAGKLLGRATAKAETMDAVDLAEALSKPLAEVLRATPVIVRIDPRAEAARFVREALWLCRHRQWDGALTAAEVALTLAPRDAEILEPAAQVFFFATSETIDPGRSGLPPRPIHASLQKVNDALSRAERGMTTAELLLRTERETAGPPLRRFLAIAGDADSPYGTPGSPVGLASLETCFPRLLMVEDEHSPQTRARLASLQQRYRAMCKDAGAQACRVVRDRQTFIQYTNSLSILLGNVAWYAPTGRIWADDTAEFLDAWLEPAAQYGVFWDESFTLNLMFTPIGGRAAQGDRVGQAGQWVLLPGDLERLSAVYVRMTQHREPAVAVLGHACRLLTYLSLRQPLRADQHRVFRQFLVRALATIRAPAPGDPAATRAICYYAILDAIEALAEEEDRRGEFADLLEFMLSRRELVRGVAAAACEPVHTAYSYYAPYLHRAPGRRTTTTVPPSDYDKLAAAGRRILAAIARGELVSLDGSPAAARFRVIASDEQIFLARPELRPQPVAPWRQARRLVNVAREPGLRAISRAVVRGQTAWTVGIGNDAQDPQGYWQLMAVDLRSGDCRRWSRVPHARGAVPPRIPLYSDNCHLEVDDTRAYVGSFYQGILLLPLGGGPPVWLQHRDDVNVQQQLPSNRVFSLAALDGKLYASVGAFSGEGTFLVSVDLADRSVRTISSSRAVTGRPLDDREQPPLVFLPMLKDPRQHRVLFVVSYPLADAGLWEIDTRGDRIRRLTAHDRYVSWISDVRDGCVLLALANASATQWEAIEYDLARDASQRVFLCGDRPAVNAKAADDARVTPDWLAQPPYLRVGQWWWTGWPFGRISRGGRFGELLPFPEDQPQLLAELLGLDHEFAWRQMEPLGNDKILWCDRHGIWVLDLSAAGGSDAR